MFLPTFPAPECNARPHAPQKRPHELRVRENELAVGGGARGGAPRGGPGVAWPAHDLVEGGVVHASDEVAHVGVHLAGVDVVVEGAEPVANGLVEHARRLALPALGGVLRCNNTQARGVESHQEDVSKDRQRFESAWRSGAEVGAERDDAAQRTGGDSL